MVHVGVALKKKELYEVLNSGIFRLQNEVLGEISGNFHPAVTLKLHFEAWNTKNARYNNLIINY
jgi:hypothetical protein